VGTTENFGVEKLRRCVLRRYVKSVSDIVWQDVNCVIADLHVLCEPELTWTYLHCLGNSQLQLFCFYLYRMTRKKKEQRYVSFS